MFYLKASDREQLETALIEAGWLVIGEGEEGEREENFYTRGHSLDIIGSYQRQVGDTVIDEDGVPHAEFENVDGYHANLLLHGSEIPDSLQPFFMDGKDGRPDSPASPVRVFA